MSSISTPTLDVERREQQPVRGLAELQRVSGGYSDTQVREAAVRAAFGPALSDPHESGDILDIGSGTGSLLAQVHRERPGFSLWGIDVGDYMGPDDPLRAIIRFAVGRAEDLLPGLGSFKVITMVEVYEHLERPREVVRLAARKLLPGGRLVITSPNFANLRHCIELPVRGQLTSFRPSNPSHFQPMIPHVVEALLHEEGLTTAHAYAASDALPGGHGRWPKGLTRRPRTARWTTSSQVIAGVRPG